MNTSQVNQATTEIGKTVVGAIGLINLYGSEEDMRKLAHAFYDIRDIVRKGMSSTRPEITSLRGYVLDGLNATGVILEQAELAAPPEDAFFPAVEP